MTTSGSGFFHTNYKQDMVIFNTPFRRFWLILLLVLVIAFPFFASNYLIHLINLVGIFIIVALALQIVTGYCGLISIGHAGIMGAGAFIAALLTQELNAPFWLVVIALIAVGIVIGAIVALPLKRVKGVYSVMSTLAMHFIILYAFGEYERVKGAAAGFTLPNAQIGSFAFDSPIRWYFFLCVIVGVITLFSVNLIRTKPGRAWMAIRDRDIAAAALGVNLFPYKLQAFIFSCVLTALAGGLYAYMINFTEVGEFNIWQGVMLLGMIVVGGLSSIMGAVLGAIFITLLPYIIKAIFELLAVPSYLMTYIFAVQFGMVGLLIILFLLFESRGLVGIWLRVRAFFELWPYKSRRMITTAR